MTKGRRRWDEWLDDLTHRYPVPKFIGRRICDWFECRLGEPIEPEEAELP